MPPSIPDDPVPPEQRRRTPLLTPGALHALRRLLQAEDGPRWNVELGDRVDAGDVAALVAFRRRLRAPVEPWPEAGPPPGVLAFVEARRTASAAFRERLPAGVVLPRDWARVPTMDREDLAARLERVVPDDEDLSRLIVYDTSGTTGHALRVPFHPRTVALAHAFAELGLERNGATFEPREGEVACVNLCAQVETFVFATSFSVWDHALFAKVNLHPAHWPGGREAARRWFERVRPQLVTGDPTSFAEALRWDLPLAPRAALSTATALEPSFAREVAARWRCPVIDVYSTTETGPVAGSVPDGGGLRLLSDDLYVEVVDPEGAPLPHGVRGEVTVTGGRNPFVPLLRYRTGDTACLLPPPQGSPDPRPRLVGLEGRRALSFRGSGGVPVPAVDVGRLLRLHAAFVAHEVVQRADDACTVTLRPVPGVPVDLPRLSLWLGRLFGPEVPVTVRLDPTLCDGRPGGKVTPYRCDPRA